MESFGSLADGRTAHRIEIGSKKMKAVLTDYGAALMELWVPDRDGVYRDVVLGYDTLEGYEQGNAVFGATVGRVANRISGASFRLNGRQYQLDKNEGENCNHSGFHGFHRRLFSVEHVDESSVEFHLDSPHMDQGYPGNLSLSVCYRLTDEMLEIDYRAVSDQDTLLNVTNHSYFQLEGQGEGDILDHQLQFFADSFLPLRGADSIPAGEPESVAGTPFDFRQPRRIGDLIAAKNEQICYGDGYNHHFLISHQKGEVRPAARVYAPSSGIAMEVWTDLPGVQFYSGNVLEREMGKRGKMYGPRSGLALETQYEPDSVHLAGAQPCILRAGCAWDSRTQYRFRILHKTE